MRKLERKIIQLLDDEFPNWRLVGKQRRNNHYVISNGRLKVFAASTPKQNQTVLKNVRQQIRRANNPAYRQ